MQLMTSKIKKIINTVKSSQFLSNIVRIASANIISQAVLLATTPVLTRIYTPENFGVAALFLTALRLTGSISTWRFDRTIPNAGSKLSALILCCWGVLFILATCSLASLIIYLDRNYAKIWDGIRDLDGLIYFLPVAIFLTGGVQLGIAWFARGTDLQPFSRSILVYTIAYIVVAMACGLFDFSNSGLILAAVAALLAQLVSLLFYFPSTVPVRRLTVRRFYSIFKQHINVATTATGVTFVNTLSLTAPVFLLSQVYALSDLGIYALMSRLITTPLGVLTKALSISFWSRAAELGRENKLKDLHQLYKRVCLIMTIPAMLAALVCLVGSLVVVPILGSQWQDAGPVLLAIIPYLVGLSIASPTNHLWVIKRQSYQFIADGTRLILMVVCTVCAYYFEWSFGMAVLSLSLSSLVGHMILIAIHMVLHKALMQRQKLI